jgi:hypothetical protein
MLPLRKTLAIAIPIFILLSVFILGQESEEKDIWKPFRFFEGIWEGTGEGQSGLSKIETEFKFVLGDNYLQMTNEAVFEPQEKNPEGEVHEDLGLISYDSSREKFVLRQFHVEGYVNQYVLDSLSSDGRSFVFVTESIENVPPGWRARLTYRIENEDELKSLFELAAPEKDFWICSENHLRRK